MFAPRFIIVVRDVAKGGKDAIQIMRIFPSNVLFDNRNSSRPPTTLWFPCGN
jgi:hypothetical protein